MNSPLWIWQQSDWPHFQWQSDALAPLLRSCVEMQGRLEQLNVGSVPSSLARRLGIHEQGATTARSEGLAELMLDATRGYDQPLTLQRLLTWNHWLFPAAEDGLSKAVLVGQLRDETTLQVISGRLDKPTVHFQAPPRDGLEEQVAAFLDWFASSRHATHLDPLLRAGVAHFWFITLHPFDDGNGRLTRAITDLALAQAEQQAIRFYAMSASILEDRAGYYQIQESSQKDGLDITRWLTWFLETLLRSLEQALLNIDWILTKARFWHVHRADGLLPEQVKVLNRLLDGGPRGFEEGINAAQYQAVAKVSKATATRHLTDLLDKACLARLPGGGRSTRYRINTQDISST
ncbi:DUF4172 domain-containing protein [Pseudomonas sp. NGC7]|uniref:DUF4172 domain-containing protein n=1 Tax=Pseudomonas sp. NGC7 TaxID=3341775 RepID=UPI0037DBE08B